MYFNKPKSKTPFSLKLIKVTNFKTRVFMALKREFTKQWSKQQVCIVGKCEQVSVVARISLVVAVTGKWG